ncbi:hypothetical protein YGH009_06390 [Helicobacter pylori]
MDLLIKWIAQNSHKPHEDRLDASDLARKEKKAVRVELQKSIDENLKALKKISIILLQKITNI